MNGKIVNIVASSKIYGNIDIETLSYLLPNSQYEPEQFPGVIYKPYQTSLTALIFHSGKIVVVGAKSQ
jgi:transcription initiation factor TFIID TATA-box-binding protein